MDESKRISDLEFEKIIKEAMESEFRVSELVCAARPRRPMLRFTSTRRARGLIARSRGGRGRSGNSASAVFTFVGGSGRGAYPKKRRPEQ